MLEGRNIHCSYGETEVLREISFSLQEGELLCIIGANGSGKSTLLHALTGLVPAQGEISLLGKPLASVKGKKRAQAMALLSQHSHVEFPYTVWDTVAMGRYCHHSWGLSPLSTQEQALVSQCIAKVGLEGEKDNLLSQLSGGQLQRVYLARTFAQNPRIILLDEPTNHLDLKVQLDLLQHLKQWLQEAGHGMIGVFHDLNLVRHYADKVLLLERGHCVAFGSREEVMTKANLIQAFHLDVCAFMEDSYKKWKE